MKRIKGFFTKYLRSDNMNTFVTFSLALVGMFAGPIMSLLYSKSPWWVFGGFAISICACLAFSICSFIYVNKWHGMLIAMKNFKHLFAAQAYIAKFHNSTHKNTSFEIKSLNIEYIIKQKYHDPDTNRDYLPFVVEYTINSVVQSEVTTVYYHMLSHKNPNKTRNISIRFCYDDGTAFTKPQPTWADDDPQKGGFSIHQLTLPETKYKGDSLKYKVIIQFDKESGLLVGETNNLLYYPENFSRDYSIPVSTGKSKDRRDSIKDANTFIKLTVSQDYYDCFMAPRIRDIRSINKGEDFENLTTKGFKPNDGSYYTTVISQKDTFFAVELTPLESKN